MNFFDFVTEITEAVKEEIGEEANVCLNQITKNNGVMMQGLTISRGTCNISPTIYLNDFYERFQKNMTKELIVKEILEIFEQSERKENLDMDFFTNFEKAQKNIVFKLVNYEKNKELLQEIPHVPYLDLAIVFYYLVQNDCLSNATILIYNSHMKNWGTTTDQLYEISNRNTPQLLHSDLRSMEEVMSELFEESLKKEWKASVERTMEEKANFDIDDSMVKDVADKMVETVIDRENELGMYVLSNRERINGAACILYQDILQIFAEKLKRDLYILPSSIHEVILIPACETIDSKQLAEMVKEVNETQVEEQEVLSDSVYFYSREQQKVCCL